MGKNRQDKMSMALQSLRNALAARRAQISAKQASPGIPGSWIDKAAQPVSLIPRWLNTIRDLLEDVSSDASDEFFDLLPNIRYGQLQVFEDGLITAKCSVRKDDFNMYVDLEGASGQAKLGCNCELWEADADCAHVFGLLHTLHRQLTDRNSALATHIRARQFQTNRPDMQRFRFDPAVRYRQWLDDLAPADFDASQLEFDAALPAISEQTQARLIWNLSISDGHFELCPILQTPKKKGTGWTKGRRISLDSLRDCAAPLSDADRRVRELIEIDTSYYRPSLCLDCIRALSNLVGEPNVFYEGAPVQVSLTTAAIALEKNARGLRFAICGYNRDCSRVVVAEPFMVHLRPDLPLIEVSSITQPQEEVIRKIIGMTEFPESHTAEVLETARRLQKIISVQLPESLGGRVVAEDYQPVVLLRSRTDGRLDYGLRVRDSAGKLLFPGKGALLRSAQRGQEQVQIIRSADRELSMCRELAERFGLDHVTLQGTSDDFDVSLDLLEKLQQAEEQQHLELLWDSSSQAPVRVLGSITASNVRVGIDKKRDWFQLSGACDLGTTSIELRDLLSDLHNVDDRSCRGNFVRLGDKGWAKISNQLRSQLQQLHDAVNQERGALKFDASAAPAIRNLLAEQVELNATAAWHACLQRLERAENVSSELPDQLQAELRDYQRDGYAWLKRLAEWGVGGILADDMGLGKTLQTLAIILDRAPQGPSLVIAPTSVGFNWVREAQRFTPSLNVQLYRETERADFLQAVGPNSLVICSYGLALRDAAALAGVQWTTLVLDEAQAVKNSRSKTAGAIANIPADWKLALTGTPVENHLGELWSLFSIIAPGVLGGWEQFRRRFAAPIEKNQDEDRRLALRNRLRPFLLRRTKDQVLKDLPPRTEMNLLVELTPAERELYNAVRRSALGEIDELAKLPDIQDQRFRILALLTRLRQLACSPRLVHDNWSERSSKLQQLCETLHELREEGHRVLVFSQFVQHLQLIRQMLDEERISYEYLDGSTDPQTRQQRVDSFQQGSATVFLISLKAGGTGLNLTAADYVIHMDPWWNPAVEDQATDRAHRIGQDKPVMVYRLIASGTVEEEILRLHDSKRDLVAGILEGSQTAAKLSTDDLIALLRQ